MSTARRFYLLAIPVIAEVIPSSGAWAPMNSVWKMRISVTVDLWYDFTTPVLYKLWFCLCSPASACHMQQEFTGVWWFCGQILLEADYRMYFLCKMCSSLCDLWRWEIKYMGGFVLFLILCESECRWLMTKHHHYRSIDLAGQRRARLYVPRRCFISKVIG